MSQTRQMPALTPRSPEWEHCVLRVWAFVSIGLLLCCLLTRPLRAAGLPLDASDPGPKPTSTSEEEREKEYLVKAAFLFQLIRYTTWSESCFDKKDSPIVFLVVGKDPFGKILEKTFDGKELKGRKILIKREKVVPKAIEAHVIFAGALPKQERAKLLSHCVKQPVLLTGEDDDFAVDGAHVRLFLEERKLRFEINVDSVNSAGLEISSQLLKLARIVKSKEGESK